MIVKIQDKHQRSWYLAFVGGPVVNGILLPAKLKEGQTVNAGDKIGSFELGSTCCIASPIEINTEINNHVDIFKNF